MSSLIKLNTDTSPSISVWAIQESIALVIGALLSLGVFFLDFTSLGAAFVSGCPFRSPFSESDVIRFVFENLQAISKWTPCEWLSLKRLRRLWSGPWSQYMYSLAPLQQQRTQQTQIQAQPQPLAESQPSNHASSTPPTSAASHSASPASAVITTTTATPIAAAAAATSDSAKAGNGNIVTRIVRALHTFEPTEAGELGFEKGNIIKVVDRGYKDWWRGQLKGHTGIFPVNYVVRFFIFILFLCFEFTNLSYSFAAPHFRMLLRFYFRNPSLAGIIKVDPM